MTADRATWRDFICAPDHPYRHLASLGASVRGANSDSLDLAGLDDFLHKLRGEHDVTLLADMVDLVSGPYVSFVADQLLRLLDALANEMESRDEIVGPGLRGNPRWDRTVVARMAGVLPVGRYYSRTAHRSFELPENQLLRWLIDELLTSVRNLTRRSASATPHTSLVTILKHCEEAVGHHWLSQLSVPAYLSPNMIEAANRSRRPEYRVAAELAEARARLKSPSEDARWFATLMLLAVGWLEPVSDDDMFELYALTLVVDVIAQELGFGEPEEYGLVSSSRGHVAAFRNSAGKLRVIFDQSPSGKLRAKDRYRNIVAGHHGVTGNARRPDISIIYEGPQVQRFVVVEAKRTANERYISDSIYKLFGYLYDFAALWTDDHPNPRSILLVPDGVSRASDHTFVEAAIVSGSDRAGLAAALRSAIL
ncbi:hypothetical protein [Sandaracinobacteroides hominis]|uniref:hypothetical protein n=1 Tax=Sandaracinobacteroides hominis TaxID=2780086 RepID=UPI0018F32196|nr:hypothetical protein [Sandaracinobacteroides hominis]